MKALTEFCYDSETSWRQVPSSATEQAANLQVFDIQKIGFQYTDFFKEIFKKTTRVLYINCHISEIITAECRSVP